MNLNVRKSIHHSALCQKQNMSKKQNVDWKRFEEFVARIYKEIDSNAEVKHNEEVEGRQIDVTIRKKVVGIDLLIIIQAKWYKKPVQVTHVDAFESVIKEVGASKGILICNKGFTRGAKEKAAKAKIELCSVYDSEIETYRKTQLTIPIIKTSVIINLSIKHKVHMQQSATIDKIGVADHRILANEFVYKWVNCKIDKSVGEHSFKMDNQAFKLDHPLATDVESYMHYTVKYRHHFKYMSPNEYRGVEDYITQNFTASFIKFNDVNPLNTDNSWTYIPNLEEVAIKVSHLNVDTLVSDLFGIKMVSYNWISK